MRCLRSPRRRRNFQAGTSRPRRPGRSPALRRSRSKVRPSAVSTPPHKFSFSCICSFLISPPCGGSVFSGLRTSGSLRRSALHDTTLPIWGKARKAGRGPAAPVRVPCFISAKRLRPARDALSPASPWRIPPAWRSAPCTWSPFRAPRSPRPPARWRRTSRFSACPP